MQNPILKFRQSSFISEKPGYFPEKLKTLTSSNYFLLKFCKRFRLANQCLQKGVWDFFILFRSRVNSKPGFCECVKTRSVFILANNSSSKQNKKKS